MCHLWNLVAKETHEGNVCHCLLMKLEVKSSALKGRVFDILGKVFEETSLKNLLMEAIRYGDHSDIHAWLNRKIDLALDHDHLSSLLNRNALAQETVRTRSPGWYCPSPRNRALLRLPIFQW